MKRGDILAMPAGRKLDALVAKILFNGQTITKKSTLSDKNFYALVSGEKEGFNPLEKGRTLRTVWWRHSEEEAWQACPNYSTDISAAFEAVKKLEQQESGAWFHLHQDESRWWKAEFGTGIEGLAPEAPEAICKAALLTVLEEEHT